MWGWDTGSNSNNPSAPVLKVSEFVREEGMVAGRRLRLWDAKRMNNQTTPHFHGAASL